MIVPITQNPDVLLQARYGHLLNTRYFREQEQEMMDAHWANIDKMREEVRGTLNRNTR